LDLRGDGDAGDAYAVACQKIPNSPAEAMSIDR